jgi:hypothetical protein
LFSFSDEILLLKPIHKVEAGENDFYIFPAKKEEKYGRKRTETVERA